MHFRDVPNLGLWRTDFETGITSWSNEMFIFYGLKPESHSPSVDVLMKYLHRDDRDYVGESIHVATKSLTPFCFYHRIVRKDRSVRRLFSMGRFEIEASGKATCRHGICLNLTCLSAVELKEAKKRLAELTLPSLTVLRKLDHSDKDMALLIELASLVTEKDRARILQGNSGRAAT